MNLSDVELPARQQFVTLLTNYFDRFECLYDFGCGDGYYLSEITKRVMGWAHGVDSLADIPFKFYKWIIHPVDLASPIHLGPPGNVLCVGAAENISAERLPGLLENIQRHCKKRLVLVWSTPGEAPSGFIGISPKRPNHVIAMVENYNFRYLENVSEQWQDTVAEELWWGRKRIYVFEKK